MRKPSVETEVLKQQRAPHWEKISGSIWFRGTIDDLESQKLRVILYDSRTIATWSKLADRNINLKYDIKERGLI